ncbi:hypothetical protein JCM1393_28010 [Clostridium carnis]
MIRKLRTKGSILVEVIVGMLILVIAINISMKVMVGNERSKIIRFSEEEVNRVLYSVINEVKYNITLKETKKFLLENNLSFEYYDNFLV